MRGHGSYLTPAGVPFDLPQYGAQYHLRGHDLPVSDRGSGPACLPSQQERLGSCAAEEYNSRGVSVDKTCCNPAKNAAWGHAQRLSGQQSRCKTASSDFSSESNSNSNPNSHPHATTTLIPTEKNPHADRTIFAQRVGQSPQKPTTRAARKHPTPEESAWGNFAAYIAHGDRALAAKASEEREQQLLGGGAAVGGGVRLGPGVGVEVSEVWRDRQGGEERSVYTWGQALSNTTV